MFKSNLSRVDPAMEERLVDLCRICRLSERITNVFSDRNFCKHSNSEMQKFACRVVDRLIMFKLHNSFQDTFWLEHSRKNGAA